MRYIIGIALLVTMSWGCLSIPEPKVTVDNVTLELQINQETCEQVVAAYDLCVMQGYIDSDGFNIEQPAM